MLAQPLSSERSALVGKSLFVSALVVWTFACVGCGNSSGVYPVSGKVLYRGEPAVGATVTFLRKGVTDRMQEQTPQGVVADDGTFSLAGPVGAGAQPGEYAVLVEWKEGAGKLKGRSPGLNAPDRLKKRYLNPDKPLLTATVEAKKNILPVFELQ
jgi:hypothetical protein